jgi:transcriptional regulator with GAF, ATPase, and Fis domain
MSPHEPRVENALGVSEGMRRVEVLLRRVANIDSLLLITGENGVGKEVAAKFVHQISTRANEPFVAVNCGAIPNDLIESQLFGHEKGAFTSAQARHHGFVERARNGILFLDEVGELPMLTQVKLLRLIQERVFTRVGGETAINTSARIICATNTDLEAAVAEGRFRRDLYYRINVIPSLFPRFATGRTTSYRSHNCSCASFRRRFTVISRASHRKLSRLCSITAGPAMCGSCATVLSGQ